MNNWPATLVPPLTQAQSLARLTSMLSPSDYPVLSAAELADLLNANRAPDFYGVWPDPFQPWTPGTTYPVGALIVPTLRNRHYYRVTVSPGSAGAVEPVWPTTSGGSVALAGVTYVEAGAAPWLGAWNLPLAASEGWTWKAGKVASNYDFRTDVSGFSRDQLLKHCLEMAKQYRNGGGMVTVGGEGDAWDPVIGNLNGGV